MLLEAAPIEVSLPIPRVEPWDVSFDDHCASIVGSLVRTSECARGEKTYSRRR